eukprot:g6576.t1
MVGASVVTGFATLGLAALPEKGRELLVNFVGFGLPAVATVREMDESMDHSTKPGAFTGYWVLFGMFSMLDDILRTFTPCYLFTKACVLVWAASSARPYGGRAVICRAFEIINNQGENEYKPLKEVVMATQALGPSEDAAAQAGVSRRAFRLAIVAVAVTLRVIALGIASSLVLAIEGLFAGLPTWTQARVCVIVGACWPLYATLLARARSAAAAEGLGNDKDAKSRRLGPAAVQWLSYWPMFALFLAVIDPILGWAPHYYSFKLALLAFLALPQTRGVYLITSLVLYGDHSETGSTASLVDKSGGAQASRPEKGEEQKTSCSAPVVVPTD